MLLLLLLLLMPPQTRNVKFYTAHGYELCNKRDMPAGGDYHGPFDASVYSLRRPAQ
jgi:hypothetical protein